NLRRADSRFDKIEFAADEDIQITRHRRSGGKTHLFPAIDFFFTVDRHIRHSEPVLRHNNGQLKTRAKGRFIPAGKKSPGVGRFELSSEHDFLCAAALLLIVHVEKALPLLIDFARETKPKSVISRRKL